MNEVSQRGGDGRLARVTRRTAGAAARRPKTVVALWLLLVVGCVAAGAATGRSLAGPTGRVNPRKSES